MTTLSLPTEAALSLFFFLLAVERGGKKRDLGTSLQRPCVGKVWDHPMSFGNLKLSEVELNCKGILVVI